MPESRENTPEIPPTLIKLSGPMTAGEIELILRQYDLREVVYFGYPGQRLDTEEAERYRKLASGLIIYDTALKIIEVREETPRRVDPTKNENVLFDMLTAKEDIVMSRRDLMEGAFGGGGNSHVVDVHISNLRRKLGKAARYIATKRGEGFYADSDFQSAA